MLVSKPSGRRLVYVHSQGVLEGSSARKLVLESLNLVDFFVYLEQRCDSLVIYAPLRPGSSGIQLELADRGEFRPLGLSLLPGASVARGIVQTARQFLPFGSEHRVLRDATATVSIGLSGPGTLFGLVAVLTRPRGVHSFVVRGNRSDTLRLSSRRPGNRRFALMRVRLYELILIALIRSGRAEAWFQGSSRHHPLAKKLSRHKHRLRDLNAVLRDLPASRSPGDSITADIIFVGRLTVEKGLLDLVEALTLLQSRHSNSLRVRLVGNGPDRAEIEAAIAERGLKGVSFVGFVEDPGELRNLLMSSRLFVLPSHTEGLPRSILEALACKTPVLASSVGGIPTVVEDRVTGFLCAPHSPEALATKIEEILVLEREVLDSIVMAGASVAEKYSFAARATYFLEQAGGTHA